MSRIDPGEGGFMHEIYFLIGDIFQFLTSLGCLLRISTAFVMQMLKFENRMKTLGKRSKEAALKQQRQPQATAEARRQYPLDNPQINTNAWDLHCWRLPKHKYSHYQRVHIYTSRRGEICTVIATENRYCR